LLLVFISKLMYRISLSVIGSFATSVHDSLTSAGRNQTNATLICWTNFEYWVVNSQSLNPSHNRKKPGKYVPVISIVLRIKFVQIRALSASNLCSDWTS
jgi:hypothetical protein